MESDLLKIGLMVLAFCIFLPFIFEAYLFLLDTFKRKFIFKEVTRKDFLNKKYHPFVDWIEDHSKPMFNYLPIGVRYHNPDHIPLNILVNDFGFRDEEIKRPASGQLTVLLMGGSAAWGFGCVEEANTIAKKIEKMFQENLDFFPRKTSCKVWNLAQVDGRISQDLVNLIIHGPKLKPDIVIGIHGWNEVASSFVYNYNTLNKWGVFFLNELEGWVSPHYSPNQTRDIAHAMKNWLLKRSRLANLVFKTGTAQMPIPISERIKGSSQVFVENINRMKILCNGFNAQYFEFLQPNAYFKKVKSHDEKLIIELYDYFRPIEGGPKVGDELRKGGLYNEVLENDLLLSTDVIDLSKVFYDDKKSCFYSLVHCTEYGYEKLAQAIFDCVVQQSKKI